MSADRESSGAVLVDPLGGLLLEPSNELRFKGPFDDYVTVSLTIRNPTEKRIAFKIKTTAPKRYCVKPNSGVLDPGQLMKVNVLLQPFVYDPNEKNKHKFMVQYLYLNDQEIQLAVNDILNMWKDVDGKRLLDLKLKCIFDYTDVDVASKGGSQPKESLQSTANETSIYSSVDTTNTTKRESIAPQLPNSNLPSLNTNPTQTNVPKQQLPTKTTPKSENNVETKIQDSQDFDSKTTVTPRQQQQNKDLKTPVNSSSNVSNGDKNDNLSNELKVVQRENDALKIEVANLREAEIRLRKLALSSASSPMGINKAAHQRPTNLVDLLQNKLVLVIAILVAIIFYLLLFR